MVTLFNGYVSKVVLTQLLDTDSMLADYVLKSVHHLISPFYQPGHAFRIVAEDFMEML